MSTGKGLLGSGLPAVPPPKNTTLYVGKIAPTVGDDIVLSLLESCGPVKEWKRVLDAETQNPKGFGFCEFEDAEGVLRALRLLGGLALDGQELLLKCNSATQKYVDDFQARKRLAEAQAAEQKQKAEEAASAAASGDEPMPDADGAPVDGAAAAADSAPAAAAAGPAPGEDEEAADNRVLEAIMSVVSDRAVALPGPPPSAADSFLSSLREPGGESERAGGSPRRGSGRRERPREDHAEGESERRLERERGRDRKDHDAASRQDDELYRLKLKEWERYERYDPCPVSLLAPLVQRFWISTFGGGEGSMGKGVRVEGSDTKNCCI